MELCFLGSASGLPTAARFGQTIVLAEKGLSGSDSGPLIIIDPGDGASSLMARNGLDHRAIGAVLISHMHGDHHCGLIQLLKTSMHLGKSDELTILAPAEGIEPLKAYLRASYLYDEALGYPVRWVPLTELASRSFAIQNTTVNVCPNDHLRSARRLIERHAIQTEKPRTFESYSMSFASADHRIVYVGNLAGGSELETLAPFFTPCDLLICEMAHVTPQQIGEFLADARVGHTVITHFNPKWDSVDPQEILASISSSAKKDLSDRVTLAVDGTVVALEERGVRVSNAAQGVA